MNQNCQNGNMGIVTILMIITTDPVEKVESKYN
jgi:hypothetical protein